MELALGRLMEIIGRDFRFPHPKPPLVHPLIPKPYGKENKGVCLEVNASPEISDMYHADAHQSSRLKEEIIHPITEKILNWDPS